MLLDSGSGWPEASQKGCVGPSHVAHKSDSSLARMSEGTMHSHSKTSVKGAQTLAIIAVAITEQIRTKTHGPGTEQGPGSALCSNPAAAQSSATDSSLLTVLFWVPETT